MIYIVNTYKFIIFPDFYIILLHLKMLRNASVIILAKNNYMFEYTNSRENLEIKQKISREIYGHRSLHNLTNQRYSISISLVKQDIQNIDKKKYLIDRIIKARRAAAYKLIRFFKNIILYHELKNLQFIKYLREIGHSAATIIQKLFRGFVIRNSMKEILTLNSNDYILFYNTEGHIDTIKVNLPKWVESKLMKYLKALDTWYVCLRGLRAIRTYIRATFIINEKVVIDHRLPVDCVGGTFYNIITSKSLYRKRREEYIHSKPWEKAFEITYSEKASVSDISEQPDIDKYLFVRKKKQPLKSILNTHKRSSKHVRFSDKVVVYHYVQYKM
jgi:hypothetical protein